VLALLQFDAASLPVVERMLAEDRLPVLDALRRRSTWQTVDTRATVLQSATYPTLCTGIDVTEHGLYSSFPWCASDQRARFMHALPKPPTIWERLTRRGRSSLIVDPYLAWPPREMAGVYLGGWAFRDRMVMQGRSRPRGTRHALSRRYGRPSRLDDVYGTPRASSLLGWREHLIAAPRRAADAVADLLAERSFDVVWVNFSAAHKAGHHLWDASAVVDEPLAGEEERVLRTGLQDVYAAVDAAIGRTLELLPGDADLIVFSPTGMGTNMSRADLLPGMLEAVLTGKARRPQNRGSGSRTAVWALRSSIPARWRSSIARALPDRVVADLTTRLYTRADWARTRAIAVPGENKGYVRLNLRGREREGIVDPAEADELMDQVVQGLMTFRDPDGSPSIVKVERMSELAGRAAYSDRLPDLVISWGPPPEARLPGVRSPLYGEVERHGVGSGRSGNHTDDAWAILAPGASRVRVLGRPVRITDLGATACSLMDADMTGLSGAPLLEAA
jgi:predicted AlkP superfamily phosphohydrolase/phosphomutase